MLVLSQAGLASASPPEPRSVDSVEAAVSFAGEGLQSVDLGVESTATFESEGDSLVLDSDTNHVEIDGHLVDFGDGGMQISLPVEQDLRVTEEGVAGAVDGSGLGVVVTPTEDGENARILTVADETYSQEDVHQYQYEVALPAGVELRQLQTGEIVLVAKAAEEIRAAAEAADALNDNPGTADIGVGAEAPTEEDPYVVDPATVGSGSDPAVGADEVVVGGFVAPWSVDANGVELATGYLVEGGTLIQVVDTTDAAFPVVSDPLPFVVVALGGAVVRYGVATAARALTTMTIRVGTSLVSKNGYANFAAFKTAAGAAKPGYQWHHIVGQSTKNVNAFGARLIHNKANLIQIPTQLHQKCVNSRMATSKTAFTLSGNGQTFSFRTGSTMRSQVEQRSLRDQHTIGVLLLRYCGVKI